MLENGSLINLSKEQLVSIILRKDEVERSLRKEIQYLRKDKELENESVKTSNGIFAPAEDPQSSPNVLDTTNSQTNDYHQDTEFTALKRSRNRWRLWSYIYLTIIEILGVYIALY